MDIEKNYETVPFLLQLMVTDFVKSLDILSKECVAVAFAVAEFPLLLEETDLIFHVLAGQVVLWEYDVHLEVLPLYVKVALIDTDQSIAPLLFLYLVVLVLVTVFVVEKVEMPDEITGTSIMVVSR